MSIELQDIQKLEAWLSQKKQVIASLAPSYIVEFEENPRKVVGALKKCGFYGVEETIAALPELVEARQESVRKQNKPIIFNSCPVVWDLIENRYPHLKEYMLYLPSPMMSHARNLKRRFPDAKIVFIGPCKAKKWEQQRFYNENTLDLVLTFNEIRQIFTSQNINTSCQKEENFLSEAPLWSKLSILVYFKSGIENVIDLFEHWDTQELYFNGMELLACEGGCLNGPGMTVKTTLEQKIHILQSKLMK
jgi:iron only hydrogenase large subunit-like protein